MGKRSIEPYVRAQAVALYQSGLNLSKISTQLQVSRCCIRNAITKFEEYTKFDDMKRSGRPKSLSDLNITPVAKVLRQIYFNCLFRTTTFNFFVFSMKEKY